MRVSRWTQMGALCLLGGCIDAPVSPCTLDPGRFSDVCDGPLPKNESTVTCGEARDGRLPLRGKLTLWVPGLTTDATPSVEVTLTRRDGSQATLSGARVVEAGRVELTPGADEIGAQTGPVTWTVRRGSWQGSSAEGSCRLYLEPSFDGGHGNSYPRTGVPYLSNSTKNVGAPLAVQIGPMSAGRSVFVTEDWNPTGFGHWTERYALDALNTMTVPTGGAMPWKPIRDQFVQVTDASVQTAVSSKGVIVYDPTATKSALSTIQLSGSYARTQQSVTVPDSAQLRAASDQDWFLLATGNGLVTHRFDGTTVTPAVGLADAARTVSVAAVAMRAARGEGAQFDPDRGFDVAVIDLEGGVHLLYMDPSGLLAERTGASAAATAALNVLALTGKADALAMGDVDGDGLQDLLVWQGATRQLSWAAQLQDGRFLPFAATGLSLSAVDSLAVGDADAASTAVPPASDRLDVAVVSGGVVTVYLQR